MTSTQPDTTLAKNRMQNSFGSAVFLAFFLLFVPLLLTGCGGESNSGGGSGSGGTVPGGSATYAPLNIDATPQPDLQFVDSASVSKWTVVARQASEPDSAASIFQIPLSEAVQEGKVYVIGQIAYKVTKVVDDATVRTVYVSQPDISEIFLSLKLTGDLPMAAVEVAPTARTSSSMQAKGVLGTASISAWTPKTVLPKDYDPAALAEFGSCFKIEGNTKNFSDDGKNIELVGFNLGFKDCALWKSPDGGLGAEMNLNAGVYPKVNFGDGFDLAKVNTYNKINSSYYYSLNGDLSAKVNLLKFSKLIRLFSIKSEIVIYIPTPAGVPVPLIVTIWTPLDLIVQAKSDVTASVSWEAEGKFVIDADYPYGYHKPLKQSSLKPEVGETAKITVDALLRPGLGIGVYGLIPFSFHPKAGAEAQYSIDVGKGCHKLSLKAVLGLDTVLLPTAWIQEAGDPWANKHTKEIFGLTDIGQPLVDKSSGNGCNDPEAHISMDNSSYTEFSEFRGITLVDGKNMPYHQGITTFKLLGNNSRFADSYEWYIEGGFNESVKVSSNQSHHFSNDDFSKVSNPARIRLVVKNGGMIKKESTSFINLSQNLPPYAAGWVIPDGSDLILRSAASDVDGIITKVEWSTLDGKAKWTGNQNSDIRLPRSVLLKAQNSQVPISLKMKAWDNTGSTTEKTITESIIDSSASKTMRAQLVNKNVSNKAFFQNQSTTAAKSLTGTKVPYQLYIYSKEDGERRAARTNLLTDDGGNITYDYGAWLERLENIGVDLSRYYLLLVAGNPNTCLPTEVRKDDITADFNLGEVTLCSGKTFDDVTKLLNVELNQFSDTEIPSYGTFMLDGIGMNRTIHEWNGATWKTVTDTDNHVTLTPSGWASVPKSTPSIIKVNSDKTQLLADVTDVNSTVVERYSMFPKHLNISGLKMADVLPESTWKTYLRDYTETFPLDSNIYKISTASITPTYITNADNTINVGGKLATNLDELLVSSIDTGDKVFCYSADTPLFWRCVRLNGVAGDISGSVTVLRLPQAGGSFSEVGTATWARKTVHNVDMIEVNLPDSLRQSGRTPFFAYYNQNIVQGEFTPAGTELPASYFMDTAAKTAVLQATSGKLPPPASVTGFTVQGFNNTIPVNQSVIIKVHITGLTRSAIIAIQDAECSAPYGYTSTYFYQECTPRGIGSKTLIVKDKAGGSILYSSTVQVGQQSVPMSVHQINFTEIKINEPVTITVHGFNVPSSAILALADAECAAPSNHVETGFTQVCIPRASGSKELIIKDYSGGNVVHNSIVLVP